MAVAYDASSESHSGTTGSASEGSFEWTHTPSGTPRGVLVLVFTNANAADITDVTYGGVTVPAVAGAEAADTATEPGRCKAFLLGTGVPSGAQTVHVDRTNNADVMYAVAISVTAAHDVEAHGVVLLQNNQTLAEQSVDDGSPGVNSLRFAGVNSGLGAVPAAGANSTAVQSIDFGARVAAVVRETTAGQGSRSVGFSSGTSDDVAAVHLAIRETTSVTLTPATETDTANKIAVMGPFTPATETDAAQPTAHAKYAAIAPAAETDAAQVLSASSGPSGTTIAPATEADAAQALSSEKLLALAPATEADAAQALGITHTHDRTLTPTTEADAAQALVVTHVHHRTLGVTTEADAAQAVTYSQSGPVSIAPATEADAAQALAAHHVRDLTPATETGTANKIAVEGLLSPATETDMAQAVGYTMAGPQHVDLTPATETDAAVALVVLKTPRRAAAGLVFLFGDLDAGHGISAATESDAAQALTVDKALALGPAAETDTGQALTADKLAGITASSETDAAQALTSSKRAALTPATETDAAQGVSYSQSGSYSITASTETDVAQALAVTHTHYRTLAPAAESDAAQALAYSQAQSATIGPAAESDAAQALSLTHTHVRTLATATETDVAHSVTYSQAGSFSIGMATEADAAVALSFTKPIHKTLTPAVSTSTAQAVVVYKRLAIGPTAESDAAQVLRIQAHGVHIGAVTMSDSATASVVLTDLAGEITLGESAGSVALSELPL